MQKLICLLLSLLSLTAACEYTHTIRLSKTMKNMLGTYDVFINGGRDTIFQFTIGNDQQISINRERDVKATVTSKKNIEFSSTNPAQSCLTKLTIMYAKKGLQAQIAPTPFRTGATGPSYCGQYLFKLTVKNKQLLLEDRTTYELGTARER